MAWEPGRHRGAGRGNTEEDGRFGFMTNCKRTKKEGVRTSTYYQRTVMKHCAKDAGRRGRALLYMGAELAHFVNNSQALRAQARGGPIPHEG